MNYVMKRVVQIESVDGTKFYSNCVRVTMSGCGHTKYTRNHNLIRRCVSAYLNNKLVECYQCSWSDDDKG
jgi:hypothetical protein